ncbi:MAG TPA: MnhB domain-containing protein [Ktedonobacterales bacterium]|nr:MnhB domain-containing protein [Ktedonobacterales bacterium]
MNTTTRRALFFISAACVALVLTLGVIHLPPFGDYHGPYGLILNQIAVPERHVTDIVASVNFDYRGIDTIGEEFILFVSVAGVMLLLRAEKDESEQGGGQGDLSQSASLGERHTDLPAMSHAVNALCQALIAPTLLFGLYIISHGHLTPGGGFQGGAVLASAFALLFLSGEYGALRAIIPRELASSADAIGAGGFVIIGFVGLFVGAAFLYNALPLGPVGVIYSSGMIPLINLSVGFEVGAGFILILLEFLRQSLDMREHGGRQRAQRQEESQP